MRIQTLLFGLIVGFFPYFAIAGGDHDHEHGRSHEPVSQAQAEKVAIHSIGRLVNKGKLDESWKSTKTTKAEMKVFGKNTEWVLTFNNKKVSDTSKQTLYVFVTLEGEYIAANYTGE